MTEVPIIEKVKSWYRARVEANKNLQSGIVFEFTTALPEDKAYLMDRKQFDDGRYRVILNPKWEEESQNWERELHEQER